MGTLSLDLRQRILDSYDNAEGTRVEIAHRFRVSLGMVKKLLQQRRRTGDIAPRHHLAGRKPMILPAHCRQIRSLLTKKNDLTLRELRQALAGRLDRTHVLLQPLITGLQRLARHVVTRTALPKACQTPSVRLHPKALSRLAGGRRMTNPRLEGHTEHSKLNVDFIRHYASHRCSRAESIWYLALCVNGD